MEAVDWKALEVAAQKFVLIAEQIEKDLHFIGNELEEIRREVEAGKE